MDFLNITINHLGGLLVYVALFLIGYVILFFLSKIKRESSIALQVMVVIRALLAAKLGSKASAIIDIWIEGLRMIQDGEFSQEDRIDQFVRFVKLGASSKGVELTEGDVEHIRVLVDSTLDVFVGKKPQEINIAVNKFNKMSF
jgi:hypothetical protein